MIVFLILIAVKPVLGIGIGPAYHEIEYEPDSVVTLSFRIVNEEQKEQSIRLYLDEDSIGLIELEAENVNLKEDEPETTVKYSFKMPDNLAPGEHIYEVMIFSDDSSDAGNPNSINMQTNIALKHKIKVSVPYPEKHLTAEMFIKKEANNRINFRIALYNTGTKDLSNIKGLIMIFDPGGNQILSIASNEIALESSDSSKLVVELKQELLLGSYIVKALVSYDGESLELEKNLDIGDPLIEILNLGVNSFKLGSIAKLDMILKNRWNRDISDIEPSMTIYDDRGNRLTEYGSKKINMSAGTTSNVPIYWDTVDMPAGEYIAEANIRYLGRINQKVFDLFVETDKITVKGGPKITGEAVTLTGIDFKGILFSVLIGLIMILVIVKLVLEIKTKFRK